MEEEDEKFRDLNLSTRIIVVIALSLIVLVAVTMLFGGFLLGFNGLFILFGVQYDSFWSLVLYVLSVFVIGSIVDLFAKAIVTITTQQMIGRYQKFITRMVIHTSFTWLMLYSIDEYMTTITVPLLTEIVAALLLFFLDYFFDDEKK
ncbi:MAG TPA: YrvL family regulatory protein [Virgibacillus sp.]|nr:YrvL family regulatory protein [Virgibacillus sp.]